MCSNSTVIASELAQKDFKNLALSLKWTTRECASMPFLCRLYFSSNFQKPYCFLSISYYSDIFMSNKSSFHRLDDFLIRGKCKMGIGKNKLSCQIKDVLFI